MVRIIEVNATFSQYQFNEMLHIPGLYVGQSLDKGRGMFCSVDIKKDDIIEICPIIKISNSDLPKVNETVIHDYYFQWKEKGFGGCLALGYGSLYNHNREPNAQVILDYTDDTIVIQSMNDIPNGNEIMISYTDGAKKQDTLWFKVLT